MRFAVLLSSLCLTIEPLNFGIYMVLGLPDALGGEEIVAVRQKGWPDEQNIYELSNLVIAFWFVHSGS